MSLIKCVECGNEVSENARNCPFCGNPMKSTINEKFKNKTVYILIMYLVGGVLIAIAPFLTYSITTMINPIGGEVSYFRHNMKEVIEGNLKGNESAGILSILPIGLAIIGIVGIILAVVQLVKKLQVKGLLLALVPALSTVMAFIFELIPYKKHCSPNEITDLFYSFGFEDYYKIARSSGFYLLVAGIVISAISVICKIVMEKEKAND